MKSLVEQVIAVVVAIVVAAAVLLAKLTIGAFIANVLLSAAGHTVKASGCCPEHTTRRQRLVAWFQRWWKIETDVVKMVVAGTYICLLIVTVPFWVPFVLIRSIARQLAERQVKAQMEAVKAQIKARDEKAGAAVIEFAPQAQN